MGVIGDNANDITNLEISDAAQNVRLNNLETSEAAQNVRLDNIENQLAPELWLLRDTHFDLPYGDQKYV